MEQWMKDLNIDSEEKMMILGKIVTTFQIDILKEVEVSGRVKEKIEWLRQTLV